MKESDFELNVDAISHYMYYDSKKTQFSSFSLSSVSGVASLDNLIDSSKGYGVGLIWLGDSSEECEQTSQIFCTDTQTKSELNITSCVDEEFNNPPVTMYDKEYFCPSTAYVLSGTTCVGVSKTNINCSAGSFASVNGGGTCLITNNLVSCNSGGQYLGTACRYSSTATCPSGTSWNSNNTWCRVQPTCNGDGFSWNSSAKTCRNRETQAILPLRGKVLNCEKASQNDIDANQELKQIEYAIGAGLGPNFDYTESNYGKVIIMTDADVDGSHIQILLITFFYRFMRPLIEQGMLYVATPPLY